MKSEIQIKNSAGVCRIEIEGTIGVPEEWQFDQPEARVATYEKFRPFVNPVPPYTLLKIALTSAPV